VGAGTGWTILSLVFLDELLAMAAFGVWGWEVGRPRWLLVVLLPVAAMVVWWLFASPKAPFGGALVRPITKLVVFGLACAGLLDAGHTGWAAGLLLFSVAVNGLALLPGVQALVDAPVDRRVRRAGRGTPRSAG
jgi:hypothetical protein